MAKGILLDFEGTVARRADGHLQPCVREVRNLGYDVYRPELQAAYEYVLRVELPRKAYENVEAFVEAVLKHLGFKPKRTELMALSPWFTEFHRFAPFDDAVRAVPGLAKAFKLGVLSALPAFLVRPVLDPIHGKVPVITPREAKAALPNPKVFQAGAQALGLKPKDVAVVSADCEDGLAVPKSLGFRTVYVRRQGGACEHASVAVASLEELEAVLKPATPKAVAPAPAVAHA